MPDAAAGFRKHSLLVLAAAVAGAVAFACTAYRWSPRPITQLELADSASAARDTIARHVVRGRRVRFELETGRLDVNVERLDFPFVSGHVVPQVDATPGSGPLVAVDLARARALRFARDDGAAMPRRGRAGSVAELSRDPAPLAGHTVYVEFGAGGQVVLRNVTPLGDGRIEGRAVLAQSNGPVRVDLRGTRGLMVREVDGPKTALKTLGGIGAVVAVTALVVALTKESCPFVYADTGAGWELQGEAYAGAAFRSTQRDDLLPIAAPGTRAAYRLRLRNEARETQYTDRAELLLVDYVPSLRALATFDGRPIVVGPSVPASRASDELGRDLTRALASRDEVLAETDARETAATPDSVFREALTAEFARPAAGTPVLEMVAGNTTLLDLTFGRFFAAMGDRLDTYLEKGNAPAAGPRIGAWREREGVDLIVELWAEGAWRRVAVVPTVGPASLREIAVPLPGAERGEGPVRVRLRSGLGFWRFDRLALGVANRSAPTTVHRLAPERALGTADRDERATLEATDGRYNALASMNESVVMEFALPPLAAGMTRSAFLSSNGYYNVHPPVQAEWQPLALRTIRDEAGALSRFGRELVRVYAREEVVASARR